MSALRGVLLGTMGLALLEATVSRDQSAQNVGALVSISTGFIRRLVDPSVPLIPDRSQSTTSQTPIAN